MTFLAILIVVLIYRHWVGDHPLQKMVSFAGYQRWFTRRTLPSGVRFALCLAIPLAVALLLLVLIIRLPAGLGAIAGLVLSLLVLFYCIDSINFAQSIEDHRRWLKGLSTDDEVAAVAARQHDFMMSAGYRAFQSVHPVLFWFLLFGPIGALIYGLSRRYQQGLDPDDAETLLLRQVVYWLEWLPVRVSGLIFGLLGNFDACMNVWLEGLLSFNASSETLLRELVHKAISEVDYSDVDDIRVFSDMASQDVSAFQSLLGRTLYGWLGVAALLTIIGW
jgi:AmpE protein